LNASIANRNSWKAERARRSLAEFVRQSWSIVEPAEFCDNWHLGAIAAHLEGVSRGQIRRLLITVPPRHGKSLIASTMFPAWVWVTNPQTRFLCASYAESLSQRDAVRCRRLMTSPWFQKNWGDRFAFTDDQNTKSRYQNNQGGYRIALGVAGSATGEGGDILLIDDGLNVNDALSDAVRTSTNTWFSEVWSTRCNDPKTSAFVVIGQRVHQDDLIGHLLELGNWEHLNLPTIFEGDRSVTSLGWRDPRSQEGELLWPARFGEKEVAEAQRTLGSYAFAAQHQQRPSPAGGGLVRREWLRYYDQVPDDLADFTLSLDAAFKSGEMSDFVVCQCWARRGGDFYLLDSVRQKADFPQTIRMMRTMVQRWPKAARKLIEEKANGAALIASLKHEIPGLIPIVPRESKESRLSAVSPLIEAGNCHFPSSRIAPWIDVLVEELVTFPAARYDDQTDCLSQALAALSNLIPTPPSTLYFPDPSLLETCVIRKPEKPKPIIQGELLRG
jgi:predicted phage terminase large subunit-like protein